MASKITYLNEVKPYKTSWRIQVKILHTWKQHTEKAGETLEMILADVKGTKIHCSIKKDLVKRFTSLILQGEWKVIESFGLSQTTGQFRATKHLYKMWFLSSTSVTQSESVSDSNYLSLTKFQSILSGNLNPYHLIDVIGEILNLGVIEIVEVNNQPKKKLEFEMRDESDDRLTCTLWGSFAEKAYQICEKEDGNKVICLIRFAKIKKFGDVWSISNAFDISQVSINPIYAEVENFKKSLPNDGLALTMLDSNPADQSIVLKKENYSSYPKKTVAEFIESTEVGKVKIICTIYAIDTDWGWYYISCRKCNKKVNKIPKKQLWKCESCNLDVTKVIARYKLHLFVKDHTSESKCLLFDTVTEEIVGQTASNLLAGYFDEIEDPTNIPDALKTLVGKTFQFLVEVEKENVFKGKDVYKVSKNLKADSTMSEDSDNKLTSSSITSLEQGSLLLTNSQEIYEATTPSSKRKEETFVESLEQSSTTKKQCIKNIKVEKVNDVKIKPGLSKTSSKNPDAVDGDHEDTSDFKE